MEVTGLRSFPPRASQKVVRRALLRELARGPIRRLTTIVAAPGYGKTSLAGQWFERLSADGVRAQWLSLSSEENEPSLFLISFLASLSPTAAHGEQRRAQGRPGDLGSLSVATLVAMVQARVKALRAPLVLFLDDYHLGQSTTANGLIAALLASPKCEYLRLVVISRTPPRLPLSSLRLADDLRQIGPAELRFSNLEAVEFLADAAARLSAEQFETLMQRAEGWPVALQMVRVLVRENAGAAAALAVLGHDPDMGRFLSEQVVSSLPPDVQRFLFQTAVLPELSPDLAVAVTGDASARRLFFDLGNYALPFAMLDEARLWLRFHPVFRAFLTGEAQRKGVNPADVLRRAAHWFEMQGDIDRAISHALMASNPSLAAEILERAGGWRVIYRSFRGGGSLFRVVGDAAANIDLRAYPLTTLGIAVFHAKAGQTGAAAHYLRLVETSTDPTDVVLMRQIRVVRALFLLYADTRLNNAELSALEADLTADRDLEQVHRGLVLNLLSFNFLSRTQLERAIVYGELAFRCLLDSGAHFGAMHQHIHMGQAAFFAGNTILAAENYTRLIEDAQIHMGPGCDLDAIGQVLMAELRVQRGDLLEGAAPLDWALPHIERHDAWFDIFAAGFLTRQTVALVNGDFTGAQDAIAEARRWAQRRGFDRLRRLVERGQARLLLAAGSMDEAAAWAEQSNMGRDTLSSMVANDLSLRLRGSVPATFWVRWMTATVDLGRARAVMDALRAMQTARLHVPNRIEVDLVDLRLMLAEGRDAAAASLLSALVLAVPVRDFAAAFMTEGATLLDDLGALAQQAGLPALIGAQLGALGATRPVPQTPQASFDAKDRVTATDLTEREHGIMHLISAGQTNKQIGRSLDLTENTVKFHLRNIFVKLRVNTRTGAISAARQLGLLL
jgi:LuxR family maltose regulon positive regulatory protein